MKRAISRTMLRLVLIILLTFALTVQLNKSEPIHDICVWDVAPFETNVAQGFPLLVNVTVENQGDFNETFNVIVYSGSLSDPNQNQSDTFWSMGDVDRDSFIDETDGDLITAAFGSTPEDPNWNPDADLNQDDAVNILDTGIYARNFGFNVWGYFHLAPLVNSRHSAVSLASSISATVTFTCNTTEVAVGNYTIKAKAWPLPGEIDIDDNEMADGTVQIVKLRVLRVPEEYLTVQLAINAAVCGDIISIAAGVYNESLVVDKPLTILGRLGSAPVFVGGGSGVAVTLLPEAYGSTIAGIVITNWDKGIYVVGASDCEIYDNIMSHNVECGVVLEGGSAVENTVYSNIFQNNTVAINLTGSSNSNIVYKNIVSSNNIGFDLESDGNVIYGNSLAENTVGINMTGSSGNIIYNNNFIDNSVQAFAGFSLNTWDDGYPDGGNHWSTHSSVDLYSGPGQDEPGGDGIVDVNYTIAVGNVDRYPLVHPFNQHDIGITRVFTPKTVVGQGFTLNIEVRVLNYGVYSENFAVTARADTTDVDTQMVNLVKRDSVTIALTWSTVSFAKGNYTINAVVDPVPGETETLDNNFEGSVILVSIPGDVNGDRLADISDLVITVNAIPSAPGWPNWNPNADINNDNVCDVSDLTICVGSIPSSW